MPTIFVSHSKKRYTLTRDQLRQYRDGVINMHAFIEDGMSSGSFQNAISQLSAFVAIFGPAVSAIAGIKSLLESEDKKALIRQIFSVYQYLDNAYVNWKFDYQLITIEFDVSTFSNSYITPTPIFTKARTLSITTKSGLVITY